MRVHLLTDRPHHPVLTAAVAILRRRHSVELVNPELLPDVAGYAVVPPHVCLLKSHSPRALALARRLEGFGACVVNPPAQTEACQDRARMARRAREVGLPFPATRSFTSLSELLARAHIMRYPLIVKSRTSRRGDLVTRVDDAAQLNAIAAQWAAEPVVVQEFVPNDGWDHKLWVVGRNVFAALRPSPLDGAPSTTIELDRAEAPPGCIALAERVGKVFGLEVFGVDTLATDDGPVIVDVNAFPGCRGVAGASEALAALVEELACERRAPHQRPHPDERTPLRPSAVHAGARALVGVCADAPTGNDGAPWKVTYLRRKPGKGVVVTYRVTAQHPAGLLVTATLPEETVGALGSMPRPGPVKAAELEGRWPGRLLWRGTGMALEAFPADASLPGLADALCPAPGSALAAALAPGCPPRPSPSISAAPVRYKPGSRCVIRYRVTAGPAELTYFGKVYRDGASAGTAYNVSRRLWEAATAPSAIGAAHNGGDVRLPFVAEPAALVHELSLVLTAAAGGTQMRSAVAGPAVLGQGRRDGEAPPAGQLLDDLDAVAAGLAWWHTSGVTEPLRPLDAGPACAAKVEAWGRALAEGMPWWVRPIDRTVTPLAEALRVTNTEEPRPVHGAFKPSQVVFCGVGSPVVTDLDAASLSDPALDVGCFLAYLRPPGLWRGRAQSRLWFASARHGFIDGYTRAIKERGVVAHELDGITERAALFEAAFLLKIASRRSRRLNSPRPAEVAVALREVEGCLASDARARDSVP